MAQVYSKVLVCSVILNHNSALAHNTVLVGGRMEVVHGMLEVVLDIVMQVCCKVHSVALAVHNYLNCIYS